MISGRSIKAAAQKRAKEGEAPIANTGLGFVFEAHGPGLVAGSNNLPDDGTQGKLPNGIHQLANIAIDLESPPKLQHDSDGNVSAESPESVDENPSLIGDGYKPAMDMAAFLEKVQNKLAIQEGEMLEFMCIEDAKVENMSHIARLRLDYRRHAQATDDLQTQRAAFILAEQKVTADALRVTSKLDVEGLDEIMQYRGTHTELMQELRRLQLQCATLHESVRSFRWSAKRIDEIRSIYKQKLDIKLNEFKSQLEWLDLCYERDLTSQREIQAALMQRRMHVTNVEALSSEFQLRESHTVALHRKGTEFLISQQHCLEKYERDTFDARVRAIEVQERLRTDSKMVISQLEREHEQELFKQKLRMTEEIERLEYDHRKASMNLREGQLARFHNRQAKRLNTRQRQEAVIAQRSYNRKMYAAQSEVAARTQQRQQDLGCHFASFNIMKSDAKMRSSLNMVDRYRLAPAKHAKKIDLKSLVGKDGKPMPNGEEEGDSDLVPENSADYDSTENELAVWGLANLFGSNLGSDMTATDDEDKHSDPAQTRVNQYQCTEDLKKAQLVSLDAMIEAHNALVAEMEAEHKIQMKEHYRTWQAKLDSTMSEWRVQKDDGAQVHIKRMSLLSMRYRSDVEEMLASHKQQLLIFFDAISGSTKDRSMRAALLQSKAKSNFLAFVCHEIRNPLHGVRAVLDHMLTTANGDLSSPSELDTGECLRSIRSQTDLMVAIVNDVLDLQKVETGNLKLNISQFSLAELCRGMSVEYARIADKLMHKKRLKVSYAGVMRSDGQVDQDQTAVTYGDCVRVRQILTNLLANAVKFTPAGGDICVRLLRVKDPSNQKDFLRVEVVDNGRGISASQQKQLFVAYSQLKHRKQHQTEGTGLGLAISKALVNNLGGQIGLQSEVGIGSTFWFSLPVQNDKGVVRESINAVRTPDGNNTHTLELESEDECSTLISDNHGDHFRHHRPSSNTASSSPNFELNGSAQAPILLPLRLSQAPRTDGDNSDEHESPLASVDAGNLSSTESEESEESASLAESIHAADKTNMNTLPHPKALTELQEARLMFVDDVKVQRALWGAKLRKDKIACDTAENGRQALNFTSETKYDAIITDISMPVMGGEELCLELRKKGFKGVIIAQTGHALDTDVSRFNTLGFDFVLTKPYNYAQLVNTIHYLVRKKRRLTRRQHK